MPEMLFIVFMTRIKCLGINAVVANAEEGLWHFHQVWKRSNSYGINSMCNKGKACIVFFILKLNMYKKYTQKKYNAK